jgi:hypothetical protein
MGGHGSLADSMGLSFFLAEGSVVYRGKKDSFCAERFCAILPQQPTKAHAPRAGLAATVLEARPDEMRGRGAARRTPPPPPPPISP